MKFRYHSINAHPNNTFDREDRLWKSRTGEWYGWSWDDMYACIAAEVPNYGPQDHSKCGLAPLVTPLMKSSDPYRDYVGAALARTGSEFSARVGYRYYCRNAVWREVFAE